MQNAAYVPAENPWHTNNKKCTVSEEPIGNNQFTKIVKQNGQFCVFLTFIFNILPI